MDFSVVVPAALLCGFVIGVCICFTGVGGGALIIPVIVFFFGEEPSVAVGTAGVYAAVTKIFAAAENVRARNIDYRLFARIAAFAVPGVLLAATAVNAYLIARPHERETLQNILRGAVILAILFSLLIAHLRPAAAAGKSALYIGAFVVGAIMGLTGIGGGVLIAPLMLAFGNTPPKTVVGTSIVTALVLSAAGALVYSGGGQVNYELAFWMSLGGLFAIPLGGYLLRKAPQELVRQAIVALILLAAALMLLDGLTR